MSLCINEQVLTVPRPQHARKNIYGAGMKKWGSYTVQSPTSISYHASFDIGGLCTSRAFEAGTFGNLLTYIQPEQTMPIPRPVQSSSWQPSSRHITSMATHSMTMQAS